MTNKLLRLAELIQEDFPEKLVSAFKAHKNSSQARRLALISAAVTAHQERATALWLQAGKQRTPAERRAAAQAEIAGFVFAYLTGDAGEHADSGIAALHELGRHGEVELIRSLAKR